MDYGSIVVVLGLAVLILGVTLMMRGSAGAEAEPPDIDDESPDSEAQ